MSDDKVVGLRGASVPAPGEPVGEVVELFRELLARAQRGEIRAAAVALSKSQGTGTLWTTDGTSNPTVRHELMTAVSILSFDMTAALSAQAQ